MKKPASLEVVRYNFEIINNEPKIVIHQVKVLDEEGNYIKFAKLEPLCKVIASYPIKFKEKDL